MTQNLVNIEAIMVQIVKMNRSDEASFKKGEVSFGPDDPELALISSFLLRLSCPFNMLAGLCAFLRF